MKSFRGFIMSQVRVVDDNGRSILVFWHTQTVSNLNSYWFSQPLIISAHYTDIVTDPVYIVGNIEITKCTGCSSYCDPPFTVPAGTVISKSVKVDESLPPIGPI